jgi:hypothetical protein
MATASSVIAKGDSSSTGVSLTRRYQTRRPEVVTDDAKHSKRLAREGLARCYALVLGGDTTSTDINVIHWSPRSAF